MVQVLIKIMFVSIISLKSPGSHTKRVNKFAWLKEFPRIDVITYPSVYSISNYKTVCIVRCGYQGIIISWKIYQEVAIIISILRVGELTSLKFTHYTWDVPWSSVLCAYPAVVKS